MATPAVGTVVQYHDSSGATLPAIVALTHDTWVSGTGFTNYPGGAPDVGAVYLLIYGFNPGWTLSTQVTEGTGSGHFSLLTIEAEDI